MRSALLALLAAGLLPATAGAAVSISAAPALTPAFTEEVHDYVTRCDASDPVVVSVAASDGTSVSVDGRAAADGTFHVPVSLDSGQRFDISLAAPGAPARIYHVRCLPSDFPDFTDTVGGTPQAQWYFVDPSLASFNRYVIVFGSGGAPVWWMRTNTSALDFKLLGDGNVGWFSDGFEEHALSGDLVAATNTVGSPTDGHDYEELGNGDRYLVTYRFRDHVDVHAYTGKPADVDAGVKDAEVQEVAPDGSVVWSWNAASHIDLAETGRWWTTPTSNGGTTSDGRTVYDIDHVNSVQDDGDGIVISLRHTDAIYRIDKATGVVDWKLGGTSTPQSLTVIGDDANPGAHLGGQHDARVLPDGTLTVHDNGTGLGRAPRALRFAIDPSARTATVLESVGDPRVTASSCCGGARRLPTGDWVMAWGSSPIVTELTPAGDPVFTLTFGSGFTYRAVPVMPGILPAANLRAGMDAQFPRQAPNAPPTSPMPDGETPPVAPTPPDAETTQASPDVPSIPVLRRPQILPPLRPVAPRSSGPRAAAHDLAAFLTGLTPAAFRALPSYLHEIDIARAGRYRETGTVISAHGRRTTLFWAKLTAPRRGRYRLLVRVNHPALRLARTAGARVSISTEFAGATGRPILTRLVVRVVKPRR